MPIAIDPQTGQPVMLPDDGTGGPQMAMPGADFPGGTPGGIPGAPGPAPPEQAGPGNFLDAIASAMQTVKAAYELARDEQEAEGAAKVLLELQRLLSRRQKEAQTAIGIGPQQRVMARGGM